jgi:hypothetical protein
VSPICREVGRRSRLYLLVCFDFEADASSCLFLLLINPPFG